MNRITATLTIGLCSVVPAFPAVASGHLFRVPEAIAGDAIPANVPVTTPDATFDVSSPFNFTGTDVTIGTWLASSAAFNIVENTGGTLAALMDDGTTGTLVEFTGQVTVTTGQTFTVTHDDGLTLIIGGLDLGFDEGPTPPVTSTATYTGPSGTFPFQLVYAECCQGPAVLQVELPFQSRSITPDTGSSIALLTASLGALGVVGYRMRRK